MPCFITRPLDRQETTSQHFKDAGIQNSAPTTIGSARILCQNMKISVPAALLVDHLAEMSAAVLLKTEVKSDQRVKATHVKPADWPLIFENPQLVAAFTKGGKTEEKENKLEALGFTPQSANRYQYYRGPCTDASINGLLAMGVLADAYAPYATVNIYGALTNILINRFLRAGLGYLCQLNDVGDKKFVDPETSVISTEHYIADFMITKPDQIKSDGIFFPYFPGLLLPDKTQVPIIFSRLFSRAFGSTKKDVKETTLLIQKGWPSLATTAAGLQISHLLKGCEMARDTVCSIKPVFSSQEYIGFILFGADLMIALGTDVFTSVKPEVLQNEYKDQRRHDTVLSEIADILCDIPPEGETEAEYVAAEHIAQPRALHSYISHRSIDPDTYGKLNNLIQQTRYEQKFWDVLSRQEVATAINLIAQGKLPPDSAPFAVKTAAVFTKDPILSILAAFGPSAPSLIGVGNNSVIPFSKDGKTNPYKKCMGANIDGVPIFKKALQEAYEDWKMVLKSGSVTLKHSGNDKLGRGIIKNMAMLVPAGSSEEKRICSSLATIYATSHGKRKREENQEDDEEREAKKTKASGSRVKAAKSVNEGLAGFMGQESTRMDESDDEW